MRAFDFNRMKAVTAALMYGEPLPIGGALRRLELRGPPPRIAPKLPNSTLHSRNGDRECERRRRQIVRGALRAENGLAI